MINEHLLDRIVSTQIRRFLYESLDKDAYKNNKMFVPTVEWMSEKYDEMNKKLFDGKLGSCRFGIFTTGSGSQGSTLGRYKSKPFYYKRNNGKMFVYDDNGQEVYINRDNFAKLLDPQILINGNYRSNEYSRLCTLVHEMCHYYTYMDGWKPKQSHGRDFREISSIVSLRSGGVFTIERVAGAEESDGYELDNAIQTRNEKRNETRLKNLKAKMNAVFIFKNGRIDLVTTTNQDLVNAIKMKGQRKNEPVFVSKDPYVIDTLFKNGYKSNMMPRRLYNGEIYWYIYPSIEKKPFMQDSEFLNKIGV